MDSLNDHTGVLLYQDINLTVAIYRDTSIPNMNLQIFTFQAVVKEHGIFGGVRQ